MNAKVVQPPFLLFPARRDVERGYAPRDDSFDSSSPREGSVVVDVCLKDFARAGRSGELCLCFSASNV